MGKTRNKGLISKELSVTVPHVSIAKAARILRRDIVQTKQALRALDSAKKVTRKTLELEFTV